MGDDILVDNEIEAGEHFIRDFNDQIPIAAAFWVKPTDADNWFLYIASPEICDENLRERYGEVLNRAKTQQYPWLNVLHIKLINSNDPLAQKVKELREKSAPGLPIRYNLSLIAGLPIDGSYIYPEISTTQPTL
jgi:hypothetical protein